MDQVVILARGLGTRMKKSDPAVALDAALAAAADSGIKAMIPTMGRPFLDYVLAVAAEAGITRCLVVGPEHGQIQKYYARTSAATDEDRFRRPGEAVRHGQCCRRGGDGRRQSALRDDQLGQLLSATGFLCIPRCRRSRRGDLRPGDARCREQHPAPNGSRKFAVVEGEPRPDGTIRAGNGLSKSRTKPRLARLPRPLGVSMNCWRFGPADLSGLPLDQALAAGRTGNYRRRAICHRSPGRTFRHRLVQGGGIGPFQPQRYRARCSTTGRA